MTDQKYALFRKLLRESKNVALLSGAGLSAESGVPTFRGAGGLWRQFDVMSLANLNAFNENPSRVWQFYHYRRETVLTKRPNPAHLALSQFHQLVMSGQAGATQKFDVITQNVDELTPRDVNPIEMHGSLFMIRCTKCPHAEPNRDSPICEALRGTENLQFDEVTIPVEQLPSCQMCGGLMRPDVVWFEENLDPFIMKSIHNIINVCDLFLVVGTSGLVYPAAGLAKTVKSKGGKVVVFNLEDTMNPDEADITFLGPCGETLPQALGVDGME